MPDGDMARLFHLLTSFDAELGVGWDGRQLTDSLIVDSYEPNDPDLRPPFVKQLGNDVQRVPLPRELPDPPVPALEVLAGTGQAVAPLSLDHLSRLLHLSAGVVRTEDRPSGIYPFRAAGSAGGRFPLELYVVVPRGCGALPHGVHLYRPFEHELARVGEPPAGTAVGLVVTGVPWRTGWRYRERGYRHVFWDAGTLLAHVLAVADGVGWAPNLLTEFPDVEVRDLVGADGVDEVPVAVVAFDGATPDWAAQTRATGGLVADAPVRYPLVTAAHWAAVTTTWGAAWQLGEPVAAVPDSPPVNDVVYRRGSTRRMNAAKSMTRAAFETAVAVSLRGVDVPHFAVVHGVEGMAPGIYRWPDLDRPRRAGDFRAELRRVAMGQDLAGDAAFVVVGAADLDAITNRRYRELQLAAGLVEGRLHLAGFALGYGASGMTFFDSEIAALLGEPLEGLLLTCVGVPAYTNRPGGPPGAPVHVRQVVPRTAG